MKRTPETRIRDIARERVSVRITGRSRSSQGFNVTFPVLVHDGTSARVGSDTIQVPTKKEALSLLKVKAQCFSRLVFSIMPAKDEHDPHPMPWCLPCRSYHVTPLTKEHHEELKCRAKWREAT